MDKRYTLTLTYDQLIALKGCFEGNFSGGYEEGGSALERQLGRRLDRLALKAYVERKRSK